MQSLTIWISIEAVVWKEPGQTHLLILESLLGMKKDTATGGSYFGELIFLLYYYCWQVTFWNPTSTLKVPGTYLPTSGPALALISHGMHISEWGLDHANQQASTSPMTPQTPQSAMLAPGLDHQWASSKPGILGHQPVTPTPGTAHQQAGTRPAPHWAL